MFSNRAYDDLRTTSVRLHKLFILKNKCDKRETYGALENCDTFFGPLLVDRDCNILVDSTIDLIRAITLPAAHI